MAVRRVRSPLMGIVDTALFHLFASCAQKVELLSDDRSLQ